jgi:hypothetical protein
MSEAALGPRRPRASGVAFARAYLQPPMGNATICTFLVRSTRPTIQEYQLTAPEMPMAALAGLNPHWPDLAMCQFET